MFTIISLGCPKNLVDSETMTGRLVAAGHKFTPQLNDSTTLVVLNTCGFLASARDEGRTLIDDLLDWKREDDTRKLVVTGCLVKHSGDAIANEFPEVDAWIDVASENEIVDVVARLMANVATTSSRLVTQTDSRLTLDDRQRQLLTRPHIAYLKIADGCNRRCSFCLIPSIRGPFVSKPIEVLVDEATALAACGVKELVVIAQETTFYGADIYGKPQLSQLLSRLEKIDGIEWIRLMYTYPAFFDDEILAMLRSRGKLLPYLDMPLQHASDAMLKRMNRATTRDATEKLLEKLRNTRDDLVLRTSLIVGFPGETSEDFRDLTQFVQRWRFERLGVFEFSPESGTPAATLSDPVPPETMRRRAARLMKIQEEHAIAARTARLGQTIDVIIDSDVQTEDADNGDTAPTFFVGRSVADAPDVDPVIYVTGDAKIGEIVRCEMVAVQGLDGIAVVAEQEHEA
ncbi:MAG: 30S ribosomal protein S12 methylthiotransferase RimO [Thermoguttaceae bacterium]